MVQIFDPRGVFEYSDPNSRDCQIMYMKKKICCQILGPEGDWQGYARKTEFSGRCIWDAKKILDFFIDSDWFSCVECNGHNESFV